MGSRVFPRPGVGLLRRSVVDCTDFEVSAWGAMVVSQIGVRLTEFVSLNEQNVGQILSMLWVPLCADFLCQLYFDLRCRVANRFGRKYGLLCSWALMAIVSCLVVARLQGNLRLSRWE